MKKIFIFVLLAALVLPLCAQTDDESKLQEENAELKAKIADLQADKENLQADKENLQADKKELTLTISDLKKEISDLKKSQKKTTDTKSVTADAKSLQKEIKRLRNDSASWAKQLADAEKKFKDYVPGKQVNVLRDSLKWKKSQEVELKKLKAYKDSISLLQKNLITKQSVIDQKNIELSDNSKLISDLTKSQNQLSAVCKELDKQLANRTVDDLYPIMSSVLLENYSSLYSAAGMQQPQVLSALQACYQAREACSEPYSQSAINKAASALTFSSTTATDLKNLLNGYAGIYSEANALWEEIKSDVFKKEISNKSVYEQGDAKKRVFLKVQKFFYSHPDLESDYPYVYKELTNLENTVTENANRFFSVSNPFSQDR